MTMMFKVFQRMFLWELGLFEACLEEYGCVSIYAYIQDIIIIKKIELFRGLIKMKHKFKMRL
jgi:hypothetical protein